MGKLDALPPLPAGTRSGRLVLRPLLLSAWETDPETMLKRAARYAMSCGHLSWQHHASTLLGCLAVRSYRTVWPHGSDVPRDDEVDQAEAFAWSGEAAEREVRRLLDQTPSDWHLLHHAALWTPDWPDRMHLHLNPETSNLLRAAMPAPMWMEALES